MLQRTTESHASKRYIYILGTDIHKTQFTSPHRWGHLSSIQTSQATLPQYHHGQASHPRHSPSPCLQHSPVCQQSPCPVYRDLSFVCFLFLSPISARCRHCSILPPSTSTRHGCISPGPGTFRHPPTTRPGTIPSRLPAVVNPYPLYAGSRVGNKTETRARQVAVAEATCLRSMV